MGDFKIAIGGVAMVSGLILATPAFCLLLCSIIEYSFTSDVNLSALDAARKLGAFSLPFFAVHWWAWRE